LTYDQPAIRSTGLSFNDLHPRSPWVQVGLQGAFAGESGRFDPLA